MNDQSSEYLLLEAIQNANTDDFLELAKLAGLDIKHDFAGADLSGVNLAGADLSGCDFRGTDFRDANLSNSNLALADLREVNFSKANLIDANLSKAELIGANFDGAILDGANFRETLFSNPEHQKSVEPLFPLAVDQIEQLIPLFSQELNALQRKANEKGTTRSDESQDTSIYEDLELWSTRISVQIARLKKDIHELDNMLQTKKSIVSQTQPYLGDIAEVTGEIYVQFITVSDRLENLRNSLYGSTVDQEPDRRSDDRESNLYRRDRRSRNL